MKSKFNKILRINNQNDLDNVNNNYLKFDSMEKYATVFRYEDIRCSLPNENSFMDVVLSLYIILYIYDNYCFIHHNYNPISLY